MEEKLRVCAIEKTNLYARLFSINKSKNNEPQRIQNSSYCKRLSIKTNDSLWHMTLEKPIFCTRKTVAMYCSTLHSRLYLTQWRKCYPCSVPKTVWINSLSIITKFLDMSHIKLKIYCKFKQIQQIIHRIITLFLLSFVNMWHHWQVHKNKASSALFSVLLLREWIT